MKKITRYITLLFIVFASRALAQVTPEVYITSPPSVFISSSIGTFGCSFNLPIPGSSDIYAIGVVWATNPLYLNFIPDYSRPSPNVKYISMPPGRSATLVIGDGAPSAAGIRNTTQTLSPNTLYFVRAFLFAKVCTEYENGNGCLYRKKNVWYSQMIIFITPPVNPISNNVISSASQVLCDWTSIPAIQGSMPQGGFGNYSYQWQQKANGLGQNTGRWENIAGATQQNYTPAAPMPGFSGTVIYRRIVSSGHLTDTLRGSPVVYTFFPQDKRFNVTISREPSSAGSLSMRASLYPEVPVSSITWLESNSESGTYTPISGQANAIYTTSTGSSFYKATVNPGIGCPAATSQFVAFTNSDGSGHRYLYTRIGDQYWTIENSKAARFNNGLPIAKVTDNGTWASLTTPSYCQYDNDSAAYFTKYGNLYNSYIINTSVCPAGWSIPTSAQWNALVTVSGPENEAGASLSTAISEYWTPANTVASNKINFNALPAGLRDHTGGFQLMNRGYCFWGISPPAIPYFLVYLGEAAGGRTLETGMNKPKYGRSIRCVK